VGSTDTMTVIQGEIILNLHDSPLMRIISRRNLSFSRFHLQFERYFRTVRRSSLYDGFDPQLRAKSSMSRTITCITNHCRISLLVYLRFDSKLSISVIPS
jgi:hypothetical protein